MQLCCVLGAVCNAAVYCCQGLQQPCRQHLCSANLSRLLTELPSGLLCDAAEPGSTYLTGCKRSSVVSLLPTCPGGCGHLGTASGHGAARRLPAGAEHRHIRCSCEAHAGAAQSHSTAGIQGRRRQVSCRRGWTVSHWPLMSTQAFGQFSGSVSLDC